MVVTSINFNIPGSYKPEKKSGPKRTLDNSQARTSLEFQPYSLAGRKVVRLGLYGPREYFRLVPVCEFFPV